MKIIESYQVPEGNISPDIFHLPCIDGCAKHHDDGSIFYLTIPKIVPRIVYPGNWLCKDIHGKWHVLTDKQYKQFTKRE